MLLKIFFDGLKDFRLVIKSNEEFMIIMFCGLLKIVLENSVLFLECLNFVCVFW